MSDARHRDRAQLEARMTHLAAAPRELGTVELIVRHPAIDQREALDQATLDLAEGLVGDSWRVRPGRGMPDGAPNPDKQLNVMSARAAALIAGPRERWPLAGDQLYLDLDLSAANLPPGSRLAVGAAVVEVTAPPHLGCIKFQARFGSDALAFVNSPPGRELRLRGLCARVVQPGIVRRGDPVRRLPTPAD